MKINEHLKKVEAIRNKDNQQITENTDMSKIKMPDLVKNKLEEPSFVSKVKSKK
jgi:hypothetical protein